MQNNPTEQVRAGITAFLIFALVVSIIQQFNFSFFTKSSQTGEQQQPTPQVPDNGTKVEGLYILTSTHFHKDFKDLMIEKGYTIEIKEYPFEGNQYWIQMFLKHGHLIVVFFLVSRYQSEQDQSRKTKLMAFGMVLVIAWMFMTPYIKTKRLGLEYKGVRVYDQVSFQREEIMDKIMKYEEESVFGLDPIQDEPAAKPKTKAEDSQQDVDVLIEEEPVVDF